ncbi:TetR family transcriptional regulator [Microbacterium sp. NPDC089189]|uniref:TetR/AcrR family transcriptional regulator n=1 Tax=Microbacterium sp. NPDC089189 TaxID=3154972 RepID=UPI0034256BDF
MNEIRAQRDDEQDSGLRVHNVSSSPTASRSRNKAPRITRAELRERVLDAAEEMLAGGGLSVGLHHLNMEELIRRVGVPRSSAFAAFGGKDELLTALMLRLLEPSGPHSLGYSPATTEIATEIFTRHTDRLVNPDGTPNPAGIMAVLQESVRVAIERNVADTTTSAEWKTYMALSVCVPSLPEEQQPRMRAALRASETQFLHEMATVYQGVLEAAGRRPAEGVTWMHIAAAGASLIEGIASKRLVGIDELEGVMMRPGLDGTPVEWELPALAFWAMLDGLTRPAE